MVSLTLLFCFSSYFGVHAGQVIFSGAEGIPYYVETFNFGPYDTVPSTISEGMGESATKRVYEVMINGRLEKRPFYVVRSYPPIHLMGLCIQNNDCPKRPNVICFGGECLEMLCRYGSDCPPGYDCVNSRCRVAQSQINYPCSSGGGCSTSGVTKRVYQIVVDGHVQLLTFLVVRTYPPLNSLKQCIVDTDCPSLSEVFCFYGECIEMQCSNESQCPSGHMCVNSRCRRAQELVKNETTSGGITERIYEILINGRYELVTLYIVKTYDPLNSLLECILDTQCPNRAEIFCLGGECVEIQCRDDRQCPPGRACLNSRCQRAAQQIGRVCSSDADCPSPVYSTCVANTCRELNQTCRVQYDCPQYPDVYCVNHYCVKLGQHCSELQSCPFMGYTICAGSKCYPNNLPCKSDHDCPNTSLVCVNSFCEVTSIVTPDGSNPGNPAITTTTMAAVTPPSTGRTPPDVRNQILRWQNWYRSQLALGILQNAASGTMPPAADMNMLEWDFELESGAYEYAKGCSMKPSDLSTRPDVGESIWTSSNPDLTPLNACLNAIGHWWSAPRLYGVFERTFTKAYQDSEQLYAGWSQSAWARTTKIGCYAQECPIGMFVVCRYHERGNIIGRSIYAVGPACSQCRSGTSCLTGEYAGLCSPSS